MYLVKTPKLVKTLFPKLIWNCHDAEKTLFITFDDGPIPEVTPWVLDTLARYDAKATFFCVGDNIRKYPHIFRSVVEAGHDVGNHTFNHLNGWDTDNVTYFSNVRYCARFVKSNLFRPPYGRLKPSQSAVLQKQYNIIMWDVLSGDFDKNITPEQCFQNVITSTTDGSIIVFHDSLKAANRMKYALPRVLAHFSSLGYRFEALSQRLQQPERNGAQMTVRAF